MDKSNAGFDAPYCSMCGVFYANQACNGFCSKCYKDTQKDSADAKIINSNNSPTTITVSTNLGNLEEESKVDINVVTVQQSPPELKESPKKDKTKCSMCNRKAGVYGFTCKCGLFFCKKHRLPEEHDCQYDYASIGKDAIQKANPMVKAS